ncbi:hypothetical protein CL617_03420 [archaeon]|nr:hypothetical protein [archaeon]|tara:strand:- start:2793 stop:4346 length:1554 start_codon:yes stop_codon:yes gene_type:complete
MEEEEKSDNELKKKIKKFLDNKWNLLLVLILLFSFILRLYYFIITSNQVLFWDSGEYMSMSLHWVKGVFYDFNVQRPPLFPFLIAIFMKLGFGEVVTKFFLEFIPSMLTVFLSYLIGKEFYNRRTGVAIALLMSVFWLGLFVSNRLLPDIPLLFFTLLAVYYFWKGYVKEKKQWYIYLIGLFLGLAFLIKLTAALTGFVFLAYLLLADRFRFLKSKKLWLSFFILLIVLVPFFVYDKVQFGDPTAFLFGSHVTDNPAGISGKPIGWHILGFNCEGKNFCNFFKWFGSELFYILFFIGLLSFYKLFIGFDLIFKKEGNLKLKADLFMILWLLINLLYFVFLERDVEDRWLIPIALPFFYVVYRGIMLIYDLIKKYNRQLAILAVVSLFLVGSFYELKQADASIKSKIDSFAQLKDAGLFIKENSNENDIVFSKSVPQTTYYAERGVYGIPGGKEEFISQSRELKPKYMIVSIFEQHVESILNFPNEFPNTLVPVQGYFADAQQTRPVLIIYEFKNYDF